MTISTILSDNKKCWVYKDWTTNKVSTAILMKFGRSDQIQKFLVTVISLPLLLARASATLCVLLSIEKPPWAQPWRVSLFNRLVPFWDNVPSWKVPRSLTVLSGNNNNHLQRVSGHQFSNFHVKKIPFCVVFELKMSAI